MSTTKAEKVSKKKGNDDVVSVERAADKFSHEGNEHFKQGRYPEAIDAYCRALGEQYTATVLANRAQAFLCVDKPLLALADANGALTLEPGNAKAAYRKGLALMRLGHHGDAIVVFEDCQRLHNHIDWIVAGCEKMLIECREKKKVETKGEEVKTNAKPTFPSHVYKVELDCDGVLSVQVRKGLEETAVPFGTVSENIDDGSVQIPPKGVQAAIKLLDWLATKQVPFPCSSQQQQCKKLYVVFEAQPSVSVWRLLERFSAGSFSVVHYDQYQDTHPEGSVVLQRFLRLPFVRAAVTLRVVPAPNFDLGGKRPYTFLAEPGNIVAFFQWMVGEGGEGGGSSSSSSSSTSTEAGGRRLLWLCGGNTIALHGFVHALRERLEQHFDADMRVRRWLLIVDAEYAHACVPIGATANYRRVNTARGEQLTMGVERIEQWGDTRFEQGWTFFWLERSELQKKEKEGRPCDFVHKTLMRSGWPHSRYADDEENGFSEFTYGC